VGKLSSISSALSQTLKDSDLHGLTADVAEAGLDTLFEDGFAKDIPIFGVIYKLARVGLNIRDRLFLKKLQACLSPVAAIPAKERAKMISELESSETNRVKVGEKLLYILEKAEDHESAGIIGDLF
jgi:hypothetical protein